MKMKNRSHGYDINRTRFKHDTSTINIWKESEGWSTYVLSNTQATFEDQFMRMLSNTEA